MKIIKSGYQGSTMAIAPGSRGLRANPRRTRMPSMPRGGESPILRDATAQSMANQQRIRNLEIERRARQIANQLIAILPYLLITMVIGFVGSIATIKKGRV